MNFIKELILNGKIPYFRYIRKCALFLWIIPIIAYFFTPIQARDLGETAWGLLIAIMLIRPLADILPGFGILRALVVLRKEAGLLCAAMILIHGYSLLPNGVSGIFAVKNWGWNNAMTWGIIGAVIALLLFITSNNFSMRLMKVWWKRTQRLSYLLFLFAGIHIALIKPWDRFEAITPVIIVMTLWFMAHFKVVLFKKLPETHHES